MLMKSKETPTLERQRIQKGKSEYTRSHASQFTEQNRQISIAIFAFTCKCSEVDAPVNYMRSYLKNATDEGIDS